MGFLDKLLGRGKKVASDAADMGERAVDKGRDMLDRDKEPEANAPAPPPASAPPASPPPASPPPSTTGESSGSGGGGGAT